MNSFLHDRDSLLPLCEVGVSGRNIFNRLQLGFFLHYQRLNVEFYKLTVPQSVFDKAARAHSEVLMY